MTDDVLSRFNSGKLWDFPGGIHPPENKSQSNKTPIGQLPLPEHFYVPLKQHAGKAGDLLVQTGQQVLKGQPLTQGNGLRVLPVHAPTSGTVIAIAPHIAAHPSGLPEMAVHIQADGKDQWIEQQPIDDFLSHTPEQLIDKIYRAGVAGLGGAVFPTAAKIHSAEKKIKLLIINGAECEPYITCDDRLMRDYPLEIIEGVRILRYILRPEKVVIAIEDNKPEAIKSLQNALQGANDIEIRVIPTKYPSGAAKQLIQILTGLEVPKGHHSSSIGVLMQNVGTAYAVKRAIINDEPLIERVVTLTGDKIKQKGNVWVRFGTPISHLLQHSGYQYDERFPVFVGGPMMGLMLPSLDAAVNKLANCILAPDHFEYNPLLQERSCIRCSACSDACPLHLMPQQMYWFARSEDHEKSKEYSLFDCIECGLCAYVCPSNIPLIQYFRQEKAKIWDIETKAKQAEEAKQRFEAREARLAKEKQEREARSQRAAENRRAELAQAKGVDPVQAALERIKAKQAAGETEKPQIKTITADNGEILPDNADIMAQRKARRLARQQAAERENKTESAVENSAESVDPKKAAIAAAIARAKAKKEAQQAATQPVAEKTESAVENSAASVDPKKAAITAAIARAKAKKEAQQAVAQPVAEKTESAVENSAESVDPKKAAITAAIARAKAKKEAQQAVAQPVAEKTESAVENSAESVDPKKAAIAAAIARAKAKKAAQASEQNKDV